jgi:hypothetical protein
MYQSLSLRGAYPAYANRYPIKIKNLFAGTDLYNITLN